jgi:hypothetical protein
LRSINYAQIWSFIATHWFYRSSQSHSPRAREGQLLNASACTKSIRAANNVIKKVNLLSLSAPGIEVHYTQLTCRVPEPPDPPPSKATTLFGSQTLVDRAFKLVKRGQRVPVTSRAATRLYGLSAVSRWLATILTCVTSSEMLKMST